MFSSKNIACATLSRGTLVATPLQARSSERKVLAVESDPEDGDVLMITEKLKSMTLSPPAQMGLKGSRASSVKPLDRPSPLKLFPPIRRRIQFRDTAGGNRTITVGSLLTSLGGIATATTTLTGFYTAVRIRSIKLWTPASASGTAFSDLFWLGGGGNIPDEESIRAQVQGTTMPSGAQFVPPAGSLTSFWWNTVDATTSLFFFANVAGSLVEIDVDCTCANNTPTTTQVSSGLTVGNAYYGLLDGHGGGLVPLGVAVAT